jgi:dTDP-4-dehydrorhamnose reductase
VFDGKKGLYTETDFPNPLNHYGKTKFAGEKYVENNNTKWSIIRTSTPFSVSSSKKTFPVWIFENLKKNIKLNILEDQFTSPTYVPNLSKMILEIISRNLEGFFHLAGSTRISRFEFAKKIVENLDFNPSFLNPVKLNSMPWKSKRPLDSSLDVSKANAILTTKPISIDDCLDEYIAQLKYSFSL